MKKIDSKFLSIAFTNKDLCTRSGTCVAVCPEKALSIGKDFYPELDTEKGTEGGVIAGLLWDLLNRKVVDGCIVTRMNPQKPYYGEVFIARTYEELLQSQQSKYIVIPVNSILKEIQDLPGNYAMAALPCQIHGIRLMQKLEHPVVKKIEGVIGLFWAAAMAPFVALERV